MKLFLVIDYQNDFVEGTLGSEGAKLLDSKISDKITKCRYDGTDVIFTLDTHDNNYLNTSEGKNLPVLHCIKGTKGHELYGKTGKKRMMSDMVFEKNTFPSLELAEYLKQKNYESVEIAGVVSNICVLANAVMVMSALPETEIIINRDLIYSPDKVLHDKCLDIMEGMFIKVKR